MISQDMSSPLEAPVCRRCGMCCLRGGPTLMVDDASRLVNGALTLDSLVCLRKGEWARDDVRGGLRPLEQEHIKVAGLGGQAHPWRCRYYRDGSGCAIYAQRPVQCSALFCMDTSPLVDLLSGTPLMDRAEAFRILSDEAHLPGFPALDAGTRALLPDLMAAHEEQSPAAPVLEAAARLGFAPQGVQVHDAGAMDAEERQAVLAHLGEAVRTEAAFRQLCVERAGVPEAILPFLLGRALRDLLVEVGLRPTAADEV